MLFLLLERVVDVEQESSSHFPSTVTDYWVNAKSVQGLYFLISRTWRRRSTMRWSIWETSSQTYWPPCTRKISVRQAVHTDPHPCQRLTSIIVKVKSTKTLCGGCHHQIPLKAMKPLSRRTKQEQAAGSLRPKNFLPGIEPVAHSCG